MKILLVIPSEFNKCPRARRLYFELTKHHDVNFICRPAIDDEEDDDRRGYLTKNIQSKFTRWLTRLLIKVGLIGSALKLFMSSYDPGEVADGEYDFVFVYHLYLLPLFAEFQKSAIVFDARECYPVQRAHDPKWRETFGKLADYVCRHYMPLCDTVTTVSPSMVTYYRQLIGIECQLFSSYPRIELRPEAYSTKPTQLPIRLVHHGIADSKRGLERMIELMDLLEDKFTLDLMLVSQPGNEYFDVLEKLADARSNVNLVAPVKPDEVIRFTSQYDMGIFLPSDNGSQNKYCLPNKYFEFLYAGLPVITSASEDMKLLTEEHALGVAFIDESLAEIAKILTQLTVDDVDDFRKNLQQNITDWTLQNNVRRVFPQLVSNAVE